MSKVAKIEGAIRHGLKRHGLKLGLGFYFANGVGREVCALGALLAALARSEAELRRIEQEFQTSLEGPVGMLVKMLPAGLAEAADLHNLEAAFEGSGEVAPGPFHALGRKLRAEVFAAGGAR